MQETQEFSKAYDPTNIEKKWYQFWEENNLFSPDDNSTAKPFVIVIPPPNITGSLHMGHALDNSIQDVLTRYKRMQGYKTLWVPGTDHAGIATQNVVERELKKEGKRKEDLGRDAFIEKVWAWKNEYGNRITSQLRRLGASCDWKRERFTMDKGLSHAVVLEFITLYKEGLIYRGKRIINWCPRCMTALSDIETEYQDKKGHLWHIKYYLDDNQNTTNNYIVVATTRPETMLGDTAVAVNPKDERYKHLIGKNLILPLINRKIPIIKDEFVDPSFGTGAVKVTPAHDPNDYEIGERHNLPKINILTPDAKIILSELPEEEKGLIIHLEGLDRFKVREEIIKLLLEKDFLDKTEDYQNSVGHCYRCKTPIEPYLSDQWFIRIRPLAEAAIRIVEENNIKFVPERWTKVYLQWMTNLKDWCISRQLWWGHRIPAWTCKECKELIVSETIPKKCPKCNSTILEQDPDVFDTWFSSALWPFSTLGWPNETKDLKTYYPTSVLVTAYDIIFFWVARMIMAGMHFMKQPPFKTVFIHGLIRDITGKKMSKSIGNVIDPLEIINHVGADALRFALVSLVTGGGQDIKLAPEKITEARNFCNKIWNVSRFIIDSPILGKPAPSTTLHGKGYELADKWILSRLNNVISQITNHLDAFQVGEAIKLLYEFIWSEFCDWYIEIAKIRLYSNNIDKKQQVQQILIYILENTLKLLHPFMPFETEEIYQRLKENPNPQPKNSIMMSQWPVLDEKMIDKKTEKEMNSLVETIRTIRNLRNALSIAPSAHIKLILREELSEEKQSYIKALAKVSSFEKSEYPKHTIAATVADLEFGIPLEGLIDFIKESAKIQKELDKLKSEIERIKIRLNDENFKKNATEGSIQKENQKLDEYSIRVKTLEGYLKDLSN